MNEQEAIARINKALQKYKPKIEVIKQDTDFESSIIKIEKAGKVLELAIANASNSGINTSTFF